MKKYVLVMSGIIFFCFQLKANIIMPKIFADNMVLQRNVSIPVWGWANANEKVEVNFNHQIKKTRADKQGKWMIRLDSEPAGGPFELTVKGKNIIQIKNVLIGEVWICSGQSNMAFLVNEVMNAEKEMKDADYPFIRNFTVDKNIGYQPKEDVIGGRWEVCNETTVGNFTAVGYFFAKKLYNELKIPIGIIHSSWGGTDAESWISREAFESSDEFKEMIDGVKKINLDSLSANYIKEKIKKIELLQGAAINLNAVVHYKELDFNDAGWPQLNQPGSWDKQEIGQLVGAVWLRKTFSLSAKDAEKPAVLELAKIVNEDITYVNGVRVGNNTSWDAKRIYTIPARILKEGKNVITIRVVDNDNGNGGMFGEASDVKISIANSVVLLNGKWKYQVESVKSSIGKNSFPSLLYNGMINPLIPYAFRGVLWYQGESNAWRAYQYRKTLPLLITDWRNKWHEGDFPFYIVQLTSYNLANGNSNNGSRWAELREAQTLALKLPNTEMCVTTDIGNPKNIHPTDKQDVGKRLSAIALKNVYKKDIVCLGPTFKSMEIKGNKIIISFDNIGSGLSISDKYDYLKGFEIAGANKVFYYATAYIENNKVIIYNENVVDPVAVHFGWADDASDDNLYNKEGFPAGPFRTDNWKNITKDEKYKIDKSNL